MDMNMDMDMDMMDMDGYDKVQATTTSSRDKIEILKRFSNMACDTSN